MRFSSVFPTRLTQRQAARPERAVRGGPHVPAAPVAPVGPETAALPQDPPDDLDQRVRLIGEWQLGEA